MKNESSKMTYKKAWNLKRETVRFNSLQYKTLLDVITVYGNISVKGESEAVTKYLRSSEDIFQRSTWTDAFAF